MPKKKKKKKKVKFKLPLSLLRSLRKDEPKPSKRVVGTRG